MAGLDFVCDIDKLVVSVEKQRYGPIGGPFVLQVDPTTNRILGQLKGVVEAAEKALEEPWVQPNLS